MNKREAGSSYETLAVKYLEEAGYRILQQNFRSREAEIDLIAMDGRYLVFVEVKQRTTARRGTGAQAVDLRKRRRICRAAGWYMRRGRLPACTPVRFDVVSIDAGKVTLHKNAFLWSR